ncbi:FAD-dependent oxidoreductase [Paenibacillus vietnamensis]|uniref:FAD-dependent oxidoreductase n=1 Tax=Paenibacillus vietnamensis TaxID=2590547 RepID=UPI0029648587|nr:FAD-dependent oxidoreductase [Paenibacillus vietnamensis]
MTTSQLKKNGHIPELQIVRALAILGVLSVHASASATITMKESGYYFFYNFINIFMKYGTPTFILLSSFVLFYSYYSRPLDRKLITGFYKKRLLYIIVPYILFSTVYFVLGRILSDLPIFSIDSLEDYWERLRTGKAFAHLYFVYISIQFYLLFPILLWLAKKWRPLVHFLIPLGFAIQWGFFLINKYDWQVENRGSWSLSYFSFFFLGAALGIYYPKIKNWMIMNKENANPYRVTAWIAVWAAWLILAFTHVNTFYNARAFGKSYDGLWFDFLWNFHSVFSALVLIQAAFIIYRSFPSFVSKPLYRIGELSFGIYLIHLLFLSFIYDRFMPSFGITWKAHFSYLGSWLFMLFGSWAAVAFTTRFIPFSWMLFGNVAGSKRSMTITKKNAVITAAAIAILAASALIGIWIKSEETVNKHERQQLLEVVSSEVVSEQYDVIVAGTDPEGVAAAVSAARNGLKVLLVDGKNREILGGLMTVGGLNTLDNNYSPVQSGIIGKHNFLNKGIFQEWYDQVEGTSFDTNTAANVFYKLVSGEPNIDVVMKVQSMEPIMGDGKEGNAAIDGLHIVKEDGTEQDIMASVVIDATQDGDIAAAAGAPFTIGREDLGRPEAQMAVTLVFKLSGVTQDIWDSFGRHERSGVDAMSGWGFFEAAEYPSSNPERVKMRGLNIGRQNDNTILINAMHIFGVDPLDPASVQAAMETGKAEAPRIVEFLKKKFPEFKDLKFAGTADELYIRESRHFQGEYRLTMADLMDNRDHWDAVAYGSYDVDMQSINYQDPGIIMMSPIQYGVPFRTLVPLKVDDLLVVGRASSFDSMPHGSARVIPLGMATAEAAGAAAKLALDNGMTVRELSRSEELIAQLRANLEEQGMDLEMNDFEPPYYTKHKAYKALITAVSMMNTSGNYDNMHFDLDGISNNERFVYKLLNVKKILPDYFKGDPMLLIKGVKNAGSIPLTLEQAVKTIAAAIHNDNTDTLTLDEMLERGWITQETIDAITDKNAITNGESFMLLRDVLEFYADTVFE